MNNFLHFPVYEAYGVDQPCTVCNVPGESKWHLEEDDDHYGKDIVPDEVRSVVDPTEAERYKR